jgi:hypothetical protein
MKDVTINKPTLGFIVATRGLLGVGIGLLAAKKIPERRRMTLGKTLLTIGALTTIPAAIAVIRQNRKSANTAVPA